MRFRVERTSIVRGRPCEEAVPEYTEWRQYEGAWDVEGLQEEDASDLLRNVQLTDDGFAYERREVTWYVDIPDLAALMAFVARYEEIVLTSDYIEIYDDYRE